MGVLSGGTMTVSLRNTSSGDVMASFTGHRGSAAVAFSPDSKTVATGSTLVAESFDAPIRLWDPSTGKLLTTLTGHRNGIQSMGFSQDGKVLVTGAAGGVTKVWDVVGGKATATLGSRCGSAPTARRSPTRCRAARTDSS
ncbi:WD40 repeat domain-containing protein [Nonomuraea guangzhouensis]|uniref:WD40 repeat domain-containing protein n=1 Tax=Nonomuraea guangzhouensis TaxID=1291555 RepID=A0ABW4GU26_9ACTN|nr:hypothetical protein [Nonomuraea guangzhouensis]